MTGVLAAVLLALSVVAAASPGGGPKVAPGVFTAASGTVAVESGQTFLIALESNPTTGYSWSALPGFNAAVIAIEGSSYRRPDRAIPGAGGSQIFVVRALAPGTTGLRLGYRRPFERGIAPVRLASFAITVR